MVARTPLHDGRATVTIGRQSTVELPPRIFHARIVGFLFETDKAFLLPSALHGIDGLSRFFQRRRDIGVLVVGHADSSGDPEHNRRLSEERASAVGAFLQRKPDAWLTFYSPAMGRSLAWGTREDQHMLSTVPSASSPFYSGPITGFGDAQTADAIRSFQAAQGLTVDGIAGPITRRSLIESYMAHQGDPLPDTCSLETHGCGEFHPEVPTSDGTSDARNRRVELFLFEHNQIAPSPQPTCPSPGCGEYLVWRSIAVETVDLDADVVLLLGSVHTRFGDPIANVSVSVQLSDGEMATMTTDEDGRIEIPVNASHVTGKITYSLASEESGDAVVEADFFPEPAALETDEGVDQRLHNLGFAPEADRVDALRRFQRLQGIAQSGIADTDTRERLAAVHDGDDPLVPIQAPEEGIIPDSAILGSGPA
jgi:outer membrane protein OmpA-like peptidoglycan-associated protein